MTKFADLGLSEPTLQALAHLATSVPLRSGADDPASLEGRDVIGQAQTGTGKTAAFGLPMIEYVDPKDPDVQALVFADVRELCIQVTQASARMQRRGGRRGVRGCADTRPGHPAQGRPDRGGTVGRVMDMIGRHHLFLDQARYVVLDEADEMLDLGLSGGRGGDPPPRPDAGRQTALFSAPCRPHPPPG